MELEDDLKRLRLGEAPEALRAHILRDARAARKSLLLPPWFAALERHWLYPGRVPAVAVAIAWLVIASLRFATPASLLPESHAVSTLNEDQLVQLEQENARLLAELQRDEFMPADSPPLAQPRTGWLPPRS